MSKGWAKILPGRFYPCIFGTEKDTAVCFMTFPEYGPATMLYLLEVYHQHKI